MNGFVRAVFLIPALALFSSATDSPPSLGEAEDPIPDSLAHARDRQSPAAVQAVRAETSEPSRELREEARDASREACEEAAEIRREVDEECEQRPGAGIFAPQVIRFNTMPLEELARRQGDLKGRQFHFSNDPVFMPGFMGYLHIGKGFRTGVGGWAGYKPFESDEFGSVSDSVVTVRLIPVYGGFLLEKAFLFPGFDIFAGSLIGGGALILHKKFYDIGNGDAFVSVPEDSARSEKFGAVAASGFLAWDVHGGVTLTLAPAFHIGVDANVLMVYSPEGFGALVGDFLTANPGIRIRFVFGSGR